MRARGKGTLMPLNQYHVGLYWCAAAILRCLGGHEGHGDPGGRGTGHRSLTSLKSISWQPAGGKPAISNHQVPDHFAHIFQKTFSRAALPPPPGGFDWTGPRRSDAWRRSSGRKSPTSPERPLTPSSRPPGTPSSPRVTANTSYSHIPPCLHRPRGAHNAQLIS